MEFVTKKQITKEIYFLRLIAPASAASVSSPLGPLLGQYGINIMDFCNQFNERTWFIAQGLPLIVDLVFNKPRKEFFFEIRGPLTSALLLECVDHSNNKIKLQELFKCCLLKTQNSNIHFNICKNWIGSLKSYGLNNFFI
jgi:large subunit ribosomal protein L11